MGLRASDRDTVVERHWTCARRLRQRRHELGLTQHRVVQRLAAAGAPLSNRTLSAMEHGRGIDVGLLPDLAAALECSVTYLVGLTDDPDRWQPERGRTPSPDQPDAGSEHHSWILGPSPGSMPARPHRPDAFGGRE